MEDGLRCFLRSCILDRPIAIVAVLVLSETCGTWNWTMAVMSVPEVWKIQPNEKEGRLQHGCVRKTPLSYTIKRLNSTQTFHCKADNICPAGPVGFHGCLAR